MIILKHDGDTWRILGQGAARGGKIYCHLASLTRGKMQRNGWYPRQMEDWIDQQVILSAAIETEEAARQKQHPGPCIPWRGREGAIGCCVYCGKPVDAITEYYADRQASGLSAREARRP